VLEDAPIAAEDVTVLDTGGGTYIVLEKFLLEAELTRVLTTSGV
jgi:hypothetical protein